MATEPFLFSQEKLNAFQRSIITNIRDMTEETAIVALREATLKARQNVIARESGRSGGIAPLSRIIIDGVDDAPFSSIRPDSTIVILWSYLPEVARRTYEALRQRSPRLTGAYIEGHLVFVDDVQSGFQSITFDTKQVRFVASVPYARKLEVGKTNSGRSFVVQVPSHIVEETATVARRKFGALAYISYEYVDLSGAWGLSSKGMIPRGRHSPRRSGGMLDTHVRYPSILIRPN